MMSFVENSVFGLVCLAKGETTFPSRLHDVAQHKAMSGCNSAAQSTIMLKLGLCEESELETYLLIT